MELLKKSIHTERIKSKALLQIPLEEDINVSDTKPDVARIIYSSGDVKIDEIKTGMNKIWVKGRLCYQILYQAEGAEDGALAGMEGELPFTEEIYLDRIEGQDRVICRADLEDMRVHIINSRKLSIQSVISLEPRVEETVADELCVELEGVGEAGDTRAESAERLEYRKKSVDYLETVVKKRDLLRIHEEAKLPAGMPDIGAVLWKSMDVSNVAFRPMEDKLAVTGEMNVFIVYREDNGDRINWYETAMPFGGNVECQNSRDNMVADISWDIGHEEISVRDDSDGEPRIIGVEASLELEIKLFERGTTPIVADVYGVSCDVRAATETKDFRNLLAELNIEEKLTKNVQLEDTDPKILQICHSDAKVELEETSFGEEELRVSGNIVLQALYTSSEDTKGFYPIKDTIPFEVVRPVSGLDGAEVEQCSVYAQTNTPSVTIKDGTQLEVRLAVNMRVLIYDTQREEILTELKIQPIDAAVLEKLPGFVIYYVNQGDSLWQIGKKYYVSVERIKEINNLAGEDIRAGDRLLIVK
ncbi:MAG: DUF3794 domain-containing protein [Roseburia sp.]|nr:DUF3794 domain-containing protein [Roseburia sp.]